MSPPVCRRRETPVERKALAFGSLPEAKPASMKQEWNRGFGAFLRLPDFRRFSGTVLSVQSVDTSRSSTSRSKHSCRCATAARAIMKTLNGAMSRRSAASDVDTRAKVLTFQLIEQGKGHMDKETEEKVLQELTAVLDGLFIPLSVNSINWKPHPPMAGVKHVTEASDNHGGMLTNEVFDKVGCDHRDYGGPRCGLPHAAHTCDVVLFVKLSRNCTKQEAQTTLSRAVPILERNKIDGFTFVETPEKFRIGAEDPQPDPAT